MALSNSAGVKPNWAREIDTDNFQDMFGLTKAQADKLQLVSGKSVIGTDGKKRIVVTAICEAEDITLTDYAAFGIGSRIYHTGAATKTIWVKCASSDPAVIGDWYKEELTQGA